MIDPGPDKSRTRWIKIGIFSILLILGIVNIYFLFRIARSFQTPLNINEPGQTLTFDFLSSPTSPSTPDNPPTPTQFDSSMNLSTPVPVYDMDASVFQSPFSIQIAALHQMSIKQEDLDSELVQNSSNLSGSSNSSVHRFESLASAIKESGADWARVRIEWELIEPNEPVPGEPPQYDWVYHDDNLSLVSGTGIKMIATISDSPGWAASMPCAPIYPDRLDDFARFLKDLVERYKEPPFNIHFWEMVNEPDSNRFISGHISGHGCWAYDGDQYAQMLQVASNAIKQADPQATVLMGGIAYDWFNEYGGPFFRYFADEVMFNGGGEYIDALNIHYFPDFSAEWDRWNPNSQDQILGWIPEPTCGIVDDGIDTAYEVEGFGIVAKTSHFRNRMEVCFELSKPLWVTEVGMHGFMDDENSLIAQARYVIKVYARALSDGVQNITWFSLDQPPYDQFGQALLDTDFSPKPAFFAYQTLTRELDGYSFSHNLNDCSWDSEGSNCLVEAYVFKNDLNEHKTVAWGSNLLLFQSDMLRVVDRDGNETFITDGGEGDQDDLPNGSIALQLTDEPVFVFTR